MLTPPAYSRAFRRPAVPPRRHAAERRADVDPVGPDGARRAGLTGARDPSLVPHRPGRLAHAAVRAEHEEAVERPREPPVVRHGEHRALETRERVLERLGRDEVEVVGRLVEQQQRRARQLEQQDLQPRLLPARERVERLLGLAHEPVAVERRARGIARHPGSRVVAAMQDVEQRATRELGMPVGLGEPPGHDARAEHGPAGVRHRVERRRPPS